MEDSKVTSPRVGIPLWAVCVLALSLLPVLNGCAQTAEAIKQAYERVKISMRDAGEKLVASPEETRAKYSCRRNQQQLVLEKVEVLPETIYHGEEINQRIRYAFCPATPSGTVRGKIVRKVLYRGEVAFEDISDQEFKPGTWVVDAFITIPKEAQAGVYALEAVVTWGGETKRESSSFIVKAN